MEDDIKQTFICGIVPDNLRKHLEMSSSHFTDSDDMLEEILGYTPSQQGDAMDLGWLGQAGGGKGSWRNKGGKRKGCILTMVHIQDLAKLLLLLVLTVRLLDNGEVTTCLDGERATRPEEPGCRCSAEKVNRASDVEIHTCLGNRLVRGVGDSSKSLDKRHLWHSNPRGDTPWT